METMTAIHRAIVPLISVLALGLSLGCGKERENLRVDPRRVADRPAGT